MPQQNDKIKSIISERRIKLHIFEPSKRQIWTVVGIGKEYWIDPDRNFCSCPGFYFGQLNEGKKCYHLESLKLAQKEKEIEEIKFSDDEYDNFVKSLISDL